MFCLSKIYFRLLRKNNKLKINNYLTDVKLFDKGEGLNYVPLLFDLLEFKLLHINKVIWLDLFYIKEQGNKTIPVCYPSIQP